MIKYLNCDGLANSDDCYARAPEGCLLTSTPNAYDAPRAIRTRIDKPSRVMGINEQNMYCAPRLLNYHAGNNYKGYPDNALIRYYVDDSISDPFFGPNFGGEGGGKQWYEEYVDPMGSFKPHYQYTMCCPEKVSQLSWINDSTFHREDLMSKQMSIMNQKRIEPLLDGCFLP